MGGLRPPSRSRVRCVPCDLRHTPCALRGRPQRGVPPGPRLRASRLKLECLRARPPEASAAGSPRLKIVDSSIVLGDFRCLRRGGQEESAQNARDIRHFSRGKPKTDPRRSHPEALEHGAGQESSLKTPRGQDGACGAASRTPQIPRVFEGSGPLSFVKHGRNCMSAVSRGQPGSGE